jgi:hypothetical protein
MRYRKAATGLTLLTVDSTRIKKSVA